MNYTLEQADKDLFAVYQTIYSNADIEMWYDWNKRLEDTKWTDKCYFLMQNGQKVGGAVIVDDRIMYPFLVSPFSEREKFWNTLIALMPRDNICGVSNEDAEILSKLGYHTESVNQVMCRPADTFKTSLPKGFVCRPLVLDRLTEVGEVIFKSYQGGICEEINGVVTLNSAIDDVKMVLDVYSKTNLSKIVCEENTDKIVAVCLAGVGENYVHGYAEIADLCVLPQYRNLGLGKYLIEQTLTDAYLVAPFVKLFVNVGNNAEYLYRKLGFISGPRFINLTR